MKKGFKVQHKILLFVLLTTTIIFIVIVGYIGINSKQRIYETTKDLVDSYAQSYAYLTESKLNHYMDATSYLVDIFEDYKNIPEMNRREVLSGHLQNLLAKNDRFLSVWSILKPGAIDNLDTLYMNQIGSTILGNFRYVFYKEEGKIKLSEYIEQDPDAVLAGSEYTQVKNRLRETIVDPYHFSYTGNEMDEILETKMVAPLIVDGEFLGVIGIDIPLQALQEMINKYQPIKGSFAFLVTNSGEVVAFPDRNEMDKSIENTNFLNGTDVKIMQKIQEGENFSFNTKYKGEQFYTSLASVKIGNTKTPWFVGLATPNSRVLKTANRNFVISIIVGLIGLLLLAIVIYLIARDITRPIKRITAAIKKISTGQIDKSLQVQIKGSDEIAEMGTALNQYILGYLEKTKFASKIGEGDLNAKFNLLSENDFLGESLIAMRDSLRNAKQDEIKRHEEDKKRRWHNEGIANFAELMRQNHDNIRKLSYNIVSNLVEYLEVNQGGIFILNDDDSGNEYYELYAAYAYNKQKHLEKSIKKGVGLIGTCALERKTIHLNKVPDNYIAIQSGLGEANPSSLLIVPLKMENHVLGVLELASLKEFEPYKVDFVEKIAESIASTISSVRVNIKTNELLEKSQQQAEAMSAQEEEMRQNMEELQATQEEASRRELELKGILNAVEDFLIKAELNLEGKFMNVNDHFSDTFGYNSTEIKEKSIEILVPEDDIVEFKNAWYRVQNGESYQGKPNRITKRGKEVKLITAYTPIKDVNQNISKILMMAMRE